jgi:hypothetical protein
MTLFDGFLIATLLGIFGSFELWSLTSIFAAFKRMSSPPHPALAPQRIPNRGNRSDIGTDPNVSPVNVVGSSCLTIIFQLFLQASVLGGSAIYLSSLPEASAQQLFPGAATGKCVVGAATAGVLGAVLRALVWNWGAIGNSYRKMVNPPNPSLPKAAVAASASSEASAKAPSVGDVAVSTSVAVTIGPPNAHLVGATPAISPLDVLGQGCLELAARLILQALLFGVLGFWAWLVYSYMSYPYQ